MLWPVAAGVAIATAIIVGALVVGDSVRGTLRHTALDRLGKIEQLFLAPRFFSENAVKNWAKHPDFPSTAIGEPIALTMFPRSSIESTKKTMRRYATGTLVFGINENFWELSDSKEPLKEIDQDGKISTVAFDGKIGEDEIVINQALADDLDAKVNDELTLRLPAQIAVPADSPLGKRETETVNLTKLRVKAILANRSIARFDLQINQRPPKNAFVSLATIQSALERPGQVNAALFPIHPSSDRLSHDQKRLGESQDVSKKLLACLPIGLEDLGYRLEQVRRVFAQPDSKSDDNSSKSEDVVYDYWSLSTDQFLIPDAVVDAIRSNWPIEKSSPVLTYLANSITHETYEENERRMNRRRFEPTETSNDIVSYSTISAVESRLFHEKSDMGLYDPSMDGSTNLGDNEVIINSWLAEQTNARVGDPIMIRYYLPEVKLGKEIEVAVEFKVAGIVPITEPETGYKRKRPAVFVQRPTRFNDTALTPDVPGITDQDSMNDWDLPFKLTFTVRKEDDAYWNNHRLTPKLFLPLEVGQKLFGSRFGKASSIRLDSSIEPISKRQGQRSFKAFVGSCPRSGGMLLRSDRNRSMHPRAPLPLTRCFFR